jgi:acyl carrier protein
MDIVGALSKFIVEEIAADSGKKSLTSDEDLLEQGIIDSLAIMKLVLFIEETFGIEVADDDVIPENFQCVESMVAYIEGKRKNR